MTLRKLVGASGAMAVALAMVIALGVPGGAAQAVTAPSTATRAAAGAAHLANLVGVDGTIPGVMGVDLDLMTQTALALAATGTQPSALDKVTGALEARVDDYVREGTADLPGRLARLVMLATATGRDPASFGGADLLARMAVTRVSAGLDTGRYGEVNPVASSFIQGLVLAALDAAGRTDPEAVAWLAHQQCADGSWLGYRSDTTVPCPAAVTPGVPGLPGSLADTNGTAMAVMGLAAQRTTPTHDAAAWLKASRLPDGWAFDTTHTAAEPNSTALVIGAVVALGDDPAGAEWTKDGVSAIASLAGFQLGCDHPESDRGAFWYDFGQPGDRELPNELATAQAVPAMAGQTFPLESTHPGSAAPSGLCDDPGTTTTSSGATTTTSSGATTTTPAGVTTTTTVGVTTTTSITATTTPSPTPSPTPSTTGLDPTPGKDAGVESATATRQPARPPSALATTGGSGRSQLALAGVLLITGAALLVMSRPPARRPRRRSH